MFAEITAIFFALAYVILAVLEKRSCWIMAFLSALLYVIIFWKVRLYLESGLQIFYLIMAYYGWRTWGPKGNICTLRIRTKSREFHYYGAAFIIVCSLILGTIMDKWTDAAAPYIDATTTIAALFTTWMTTQKILENWLYWIVIDVVSIALYLSRDLQLTAALFAGYVVLAAIGYRTWRSQWKNQSST